MDVEILQFPSDCRFFVRRVSSSLPYERRAGARTSDVGANSVSSFVSFALFEYRYDVPPCVRASSRPRLACCLFSIMLGCLNKGWRDEGR